MSLKSTVFHAVLPLEHSFPKLRVCLNTEHNAYGTLVVLFTSVDKGIALSGVSTERIGKPEVWVAYTADVWATCEIHLTSAD